MLFYDNSCVDLCDSSYAGLSALFALRLDAQQGPGEQFVHITVLSQKTWNVLRRHNERQRTLQEKCILNHCVMVLG
jgi:hypothetical protein